MLPDDAGSKDGGVRRIEVFTGARRRRLWGLEESRHRARRTATSCREGHNWGCAAQLCRAGPAARGRARGFASSSSTLSTSARSGGDRSNPTMSRTLSTKSGSLDSLNVSELCGCKPKAVQMRQMVGVREAGRSRHRADRPVCRVGRRRAQRALDDRGDLVVVDCPPSARPGIVQQALQRILQKRRRHLPTVCSCTPSSVATTLLWSPSAQRRMIQRRSDIDCATRRRSTCRSRYSHSPGSSTSGPSDSHSRSPCPLLHDRSAAYNAANYGSG